MDTILLSKIVRHIATMTDEHSGYLCLLFSLLAAAIIVFAHRVHVRFWA